MVPLLLIQLSNATTSFKTAWLVNLNQQVGPTPQQPSPE